ncbi:RNA polymerase sigma factor (sigma-70 family) [Dyadobacter jejuensis]|uniref:RNA polymerase sigma factor (Sigma-70 family) n=1 Tax=Dyadobacter jejuensis TaxID=1082580 RepID=A0A316AJZ5_9BACT|nr:sigma-70 family RNA polymerase sigma factor [Dyadobacter jejuensis]PWJ57579.1 RNA polymerase sigma factor (sigma-70 family) [Dyadobacter jejuensis]
MNLRGLDLVYWNNFVETGSCSAFQRLYDAYSDVLYDFGMRYTDDSDLVKDSIHDLFIDLHAYHKNLAKEVNVHYYLLKSFKRKLLVVKRKSERFRFQSSSDPSFSIRSFDYSTEDLMIQDEEQKRLMASLADEINRLPERQREILYLRYTHDLDYEQIAQMMQISVPTCRTFVYRALKVLRDNLEPSAILFLTSQLSFILQE